MKPLLALLPAVIAQKLSRRQAAVLQRFHAGQNAKQIAGELGIALRTVHNHLKAARRALGGATLYDLGVVMGAQTTLAKLPGRTPARPRRRSPHVVGHSPKQTQAAGS